MQTVVSVFGVRPFRIGGTETFARELSTQLGKKGWRSVLCFLEEPTPEVRKFLSLPNVSFEVLANATHFSFSATRNLATIIRRYAPDILHLHFTGFLGPYVWLARLLGVRKIFFYGPQLAPGRICRASRAALEARARSSDQSAINQSNFC